MFAKFISGLLGRSEDSEPAPLKPPAARKQAGVDFGVVVEDDPAIRSLVADMLGSANLKAKQCDGSDGLRDALRDDSPKIIFLDLSLPNTDAVEILRQIAASSALTPIVLMSGHGQETLERVQNLGRRHGLTMLDFLKKPFSASDVRGRLKAAGLSPEAPHSNGGVDLREALDRGWVELWYQPKIDLTTMKVCGAEALARVRHPTEGILSPASFLPLPGDPLMVPLTQFVVERAIEDWLRFVSKRICLKLAVNVPMNVLETDDFIALIRRVKPNRPDFPGLVVEVTEDEVVRDVDRAEEATLQLRLQGIDVAIDDFGQGYSSFGRLGQLHFTELKLDRSFVTGCSEGGMKAAIAQTVIDLAKRLGCVSVAEGIDNYADLRTLKAMGCDVGQGYLFAKPMAPDAFLAALLKRSGRDGAALPPPEIVVAPKPPIAKTA